jgi:uncharacterized protein
MPRKITYSLQLTTSSSDEYYQTISIFADRSIDTIRRQYPDIISGFREYLHKIGLPDRSEVEVAFEFLALGVFLKEYREKAHRLPPWSNYLLNLFIASRIHWPETEAISKILTGWVNGLARFVPGKSGKYNEFLELISWLKASGENTKSERFKIWNEYIIGRHDLSAKEVSRLCLDLADCFDQLSREVLGKYTENVDYFLFTAALEHRWKYDASLVSKTRLEYHLGMLGTETLNNVYRQRFLLTDRKVVIVPPCMSAPDVKCKADETPFGAKCNFCSPSCRVNQITKMGKKHGFDVFMVPDDMKVFNSEGRGGTIGVVGISCALTNWNGGWETGSLGIPAQGLLLDYVGCKFHWDRNGFPTDTNLKKLLAVLGIGSKS